MKVGIKQQAQLLQRDRAMLCVIEYFLLPFLRYSTSNNGVTLKYGLGHSRSLKMASYESLGMVSYSHSIVTMACSNIISEINQDTGRKRRFFISALHSMPRHNIA